MFKWTVLGKLTATVLQKDINIILNGNDESFVARCCKRFNNVWWQGEATLSNSRLLVPVKNLNALKLLSEETGRPVKLH